MSATSRRFSLSVNMKKKTTCPRPDLLFRKSEKLPIKIQHQQEAQARLRVAVLTDLNAAARAPVHHSLFIESCVPCGQTISAQQGIKQHSNRQHPEIMGALATTFPPRLQQF